MPSYISEQIVFYILKEIRRWRDLTDDELLGKFPDNLEYAHNRSRIISSIDEMINRHLAGENRSPYARSERAIAEQNELILRKISRIDRQLSEVSDAQLPAIHTIVSNNRVTCSYAEDKSNRYPGFISVGPLNSDLADLPAPESFINHIKEKYFKYAETVVIVDPYALALKTDVDENSSSIETIKELCSAGSFGKLLLYCRRDATDEKQWDKLAKLITGNKLSVHLGDIHDRYFFIGRDDSKNTEPIPRKEWNKRQFWAGAAFGGSLNGISKRPTYVLKFPIGDINSLTFYLDKACKVETLDNFKDKKIIAEKEKQAKKDKS